MSALSTNSERRIDARTAILRPVKVRSESSIRAFAGRMVNFSAGGAMLEIDQPVRLVAGETIRLGIAWTRHDMVLTAADLIEARVIRSLGMEGVQRVALSFTQRQQLAAAG